MARSLARAAPWDGVLASAEVVTRQMELKSLWRPAQPLTLSRGAVLDTYLLPSQAAPAYAQHPSAPQARTFGEPLFLSPLRGMLHLHNVLHLTRDLKEACDTALRPDRKAALSLSQLVLI